MKRVQKSLYWIKMLSVSTLLAILVGCGEPQSQSTNPLIISFNASNPSASTVSNVNFGSSIVAVGLKKEIVIHNRGEKIALLPQFTSSSLGLSGAFTLSSDPSRLAKSCLQTTELTTKESCSLIIIFTPNLEQSYTGNSSYGYTYDNGGSRVLAFSLNGKGTIDCSVSEELVEAYDQGITDANNKMLTETAKGTTDGNNRTEADGLIDGKAVTYKDSYDKGFHGLNGHDKGYDEGFAVGESNGANDIATCNIGTLDGAQAGATQGALDGDIRGDFDGLYEKGKQDGTIYGHRDGIKFAEDNAYNSAQIAGLQEGKVDGEVEAISDVNDFGCQLSAISEQKYIASALSNIDNVTNGNQGAVACTKKGYESTYESGNYDTAYNDALLTNANYQLGLANGKLEGIALGTEKGESDGFNAGYKKGKIDGFAVGTDSQYQACWNIAYEFEYGVAELANYNTSFDLAVIYEPSQDGDNPEAYNTGYDEWYFFSYDEGALLAPDPQFEEDGYNSGYDDGFRLGYDDAYRSACDL
ncbi:hypothetical protein OAB57_01850 [Bacteriovoracaceae bacterium]|nr:hypothetical protein [Bacteriovoracaceae bacterium]